MRNFWFVLHLFILKFSVTLINSTEGKTTAAKLNADPSESKKIQTTYVRIFPSTNGQVPQLRSNGRWFDIYHAMQNGIKFVNSEGKEHKFGYQGDCKLSELAYIDRGRSFMSDTLHSIYHGAFVLWRLLMLI